MLSRRDIEKELGKGISIVPLREGNIKENSINVTIGEYAWTQGTGAVCWCGEETFHIKEGETSDKETFTFEKGTSSILEVGEGTKKRKYLVLLPHQTTIVETEEVIGIGNHVGGAVHSKVGVVVQGIGDTGTMLGPGYCGHLMISLHNITDDVVALRVGETFVSLTFDYLTTQVVRTSNTVSSHYDKLLEYGVRLSSDDRNYFSEDWKANFAAIRDRMIESIEYKAYKKKIRRNAWKEFRKYLNKRNVIAAAVTICLFFLLYYLAQKMDSTLSEAVWVDRFWNVGCSGFVGSFLIGFYKFLTDKKG